MHAERSARHRRLLALVAPFVACAGEPAPLTLDAPSETLFVALITLVDGRTETASGLVRWNPGEGLPLFVDGTKEHRILGFTARDLEALGPIDEAEAASTPLRVAVGCEPPLPSPSWRAHWPAGAAAPVRDQSDDELPVLTVSWLDDRCEAVEDSRWMVETSCYPFGVFPVVTPTEKRCVKELGLAVYQLPALIGRVWYDGGTCTEPAAADSRCRRDAENARLLDCAGNEPCRLTVGLSEIRDAPFRSETVSLAPDLPPLEDDAFLTSREYRALRTRYGYTRAMAVLEDRIWVVRYPMEIHNACPTRLTGFSTSELVQLAKNDLSVVGTATAPPCLLELAAGAGPEFWGAFAEAGRNVVARFDAEGRILLRRPVGSGPEDVVSDSELMQPVELRYTEDHGLLLLMTDDIAREGFRPTQILSIDPVTLAERRRIQNAGPDRAHTLHMLETNRAALGLHQSNAIQYVDLGAGTLAERMSFEHDPGIGTHGLGYTEPFLFLAAFNVLFMFDTRSGTEVIRTPVSARPMNLIRAEPWPDDPNLILVLGLSPRGFAPHVTLASFFNIRERRFEPTVYETGGFGVPGRVVRDGTGSLLLLHPWSGELTRLTPKNP